MADQVTSEQERPQSQPSGERRGPRGQGGRGGVGGSRGGPRPYRGPGGGGPRRRARVCQFCATEVKTIDYKDQDMLRQCTSRSGRIQSRRKTGACAKHQRMLSRAIKRARYMALTPYTPHQMQRTIS